MLQIAHRGDHRHAPENSMQAFRSAVEAGAGGVELDVRLSADGIPVVMHDAGLKRMTGHPGRVRAMNATDIRELRFLSTEGTVPLLSDVLEEIGGQIPINIEIKHSDKRNRTLTRAVIELIQRMNLTDKVWISSFNPIILIQSLALDASISVGFLFDKLRYVPVLLGDFYPFTYWHPHYSIADERMLDAASKRGIDVMVWTVNTEDDIRRMAKLGVAGVITDDLSLFASVSSR